MTAGQTFGLSVVELVSLLAGIITILAVGTKGIMIAKRDWPTFVRYIRMTVQEKLTQQALRPFWGSFIQEGCTLVLPTKDHTRTDEQPEWMRTMFLDYLGVARLMEELNIVFDETTVSWSQSDEISQELRTQNLISVAGPQPNRITATILNQPEVVYRFPESTDSSSIGDYEGRIVAADDTEIEFKPREQDGNVIRDVGIITKIRNPYNTDTSAIVACGVWGWGTKAGFELLTDEETLDYLIENGGEYFQVVFTVEIDEHNRTAQPHLLDLHPDKDLRQKTITSIEYS